MLGIKSLLLTGRDLQQTQAGVEQLSSVSGWEIWGNTELQSYQFDWKTQQKTPVNTNENLLLVCIHLYTSSVYKYEFGLRGNLV